MTNTQQYQKAVLSALSAWQAIDAAQTDADRIQREMEYRRAREVELSLRPPKVVAYDQAIDRAFERAFPEPEPAGPAEGEEKP